VRRLHPGCRWGAVAVGAVRVLGPLGPGRLHAQLCCGARRSLDAPCLHVTQQLGDAPAGSREKSMHSSGQLLQNASTACPWRCPCQASSHSCHPRNAQATIVWHPPISCSHSLGDVVLALDVPVCLCRRFCRLKVRQGLLQLAQALVRTAPPAWQQMQGAERCRRDKLSPGCLVRQRRPRRR